MEEIARKNTKDSRNESILKMGHLARAMAHAKAIARGFCKCLCKMVILGQKLKMPKKCEKPFYKNFRVVLWKKPLEKRPTIREIRRFENQPSCKGYSPCRGYSLCKMVILGQKLKLPKKNAKNHSKRTLKLFCGKNCSKKDQLFEK